MEKSEKAIANKTKRGKVGGTFPFLHFYFAQTAFSEYVTARNKIDKLRCMNSIYDSEFTIELSKTNSFTLSNILARIRIAYWYYCVVKFGVKGI